MSNLVTHLSTNVFKTLKEQEKPKEQFTVQILQLNQDPNKPNLLKLLVSDGTYF